MINEHAAEWSLNRQNNEADADLNDTRYEAKDLTQENAQTVPETKQDTD